MDSQSFQDYDEFMSGVKKKTRLPKELWIKPMPGVARKTTKAQLEKIITENKIKFRLRKSLKSIENFSRPATKADFEKFIQ